MKKHVVGLRRLERAHLDRLGEVFHVDYFESIDDANRTQFMQALARAHGLIGAKLDVTAAMIAAAPELEAIATISAGYDNLPVADIHARQIVLCNTPDALTETTADLGFALILGCARRLVELHDYVRQGDWRAHVGDSLLGSNVHGKSLGVLGMGRIGAAVARRGALGFGMKVHYALSSIKRRWSKRWRTARSAPPVWMSMPRNRCRRTRRCAAWPTSLPCPMWAPRPPKRAPPWRIAPWTT